jgi:hypothetical protein
LTNDYPPHELEQFLRNAIAAAETSAEFYQSQGQPHLALPLLKRAVDILKQAYGAEHLYTKACQASYRQLR